MYITIVRAAGRGSPWRPQGGPRCRMTLKSGVTPDRVKMRSKWIGPSKTLRKVDGFVCKRANRCRGVKIYWSEIGSIAGCISDWSQKAPRLVQVSLGSPGPPIHLILLIICVLPMSRLRRLYAHMLLITWEFIKFSSNFDKFQPKYTFETTFPALGGMTRKNVIMAGLAWGCQKCLKTLETCIPDWISGQLLF